MVTLRRQLPSLFAALVMVLALPFVFYALRFGLSGLTGDLSGSTHLFDRNGPFSNLAIFGHMVGGAVITLLAPLQLVAPLRSRFPVIHRWSGYVIFAWAVLTAVGGLAYILARGTVGGPPMDLAFSAYGLCVLVAAIQTVRFARAMDFDRHAQWALRLFVLAVGSWLYRVHYDIWISATGGLWIEPGFTGAFDRVQLYAFFVPYLMVVELYFRFGRRNVVVEAR